MSEEKFIDTEPDDAFAMVLGDIDASPLMRMPPVVEAPLIPAQPVPTQAASPEPEPEIPAASAPPAPTAEEQGVASSQERPLKAEYAAEAAVETPRRHTVERAPRDSSGLFAVIRDQDNARIEPKMAMLADAAVPLQRLLRELEAQSVRRVTLDLTNAADMDADCLAVLLAFAGRDKTTSRLRLAHANAVLAGLFQTVRLERTYAVDID